jgi:hypothetical protein
MRNHETTSGALRAVAVELIGACVLFGIHLAAQALLNVVVA